MQQIQGVYAMLQCYFPFLPEGAKPINDHVAIYRHDEQIEFFTASGPIYLNVKRKTSTILAARIA
jgi:hypothetical protein